MLRGRVANLKDEKRAAGYKEWGAGRVEKFDFELFKAGSSG